VGLLLLFLDGVGLGDDDPGVNPFAAAATPVLDELAGGAWAAPRPHARPGRTLAALDATLGDPGLPQSATGQAALLSGRDAVAAMGGPYGPWPGPTLKRFLAEGELFAWAADRFGVPAIGWGTAYPPSFFAALARGRLRLNVPAWAARRSGVELPDLDAYRRGEAVAADLDGSAFAAHGVEPPGGHRPGPAGAGEAGRRLADAAAERALTFVDVWTPDRAGHRADAAEGRALVARLDAFLGGLLAARDAATTVLVVSDHGNLEDLRHGRHTRAPVPLLAVGPEAEAFADARSLLDVAPAVRRTWTAS
jgi:hypothetical protein